MATPDYVVLNLGHLAEGRGCCLDGLTTAKAAVKGTDAERGVIGAGRVDLLRRVGELWRGDWTGRSFDGRDGQGWIDTALHGDAADLRKLDTELAKMEAAD